MSTALCPNTLQPGRLPATAADPRENPSPSISHTCPQKRGGGAGTNPVTTGQDTGLLSPALAGGTFVTSSKEVASDIIPILVGNASSRPCKGDKVHPQEGTADTFTPPHTLSLLRGSPSAPAADGSGMGDTAPALHPHWKHLCACKQSWLQAVGIPPPSRAPSSPCPPSTRSSHMAGSSPGKRCRLLLFLPSNNIFPVQNNTGKVGRLLLLFQARLPLLPQNW